MDISSPSLKLINSLSFNGDRMHFSNLVLKEVVDGAVASDRQHALELITNYKYMNMLSYSIVIFHINMVEFTLVLTHQFCLNLLSNVCWSHVILAITEISLGCRCHFERSDWWRVDELLLGEKWSKWNCTYLCNRLGNLPHIRQS